MTETRILVHVHHPEFTLWNLPPGLGESWQERFASRGARVVVARDADSFHAELERADALVGGGLTERNFPRARRLRWIQAPSAGVGWLLFPDLVQSEVVVTNARGVHAVPMAEHLLGLMLSLVRKLHRARDFQTSRAWGQEALWKEEPLFDELAGRTLGVVGLGAVGSALAERARALGLGVLAVRRRPERGGPADEVRGVEELPWLLAASDFVADCLPHTRASEGLFDASAFARMRRGAYFLNVGRGSTVVEPDLVAALESGHLGGAGLDVTAEEPLPEASPLYRNPRVVLTPHVSGSSRRFWERAAALFADNIERFLDGRALLNQVDKVEGY